MTVDWSELLIDVHLIDTAQQNYFPVYGNHHPVGMLFSI